MSRVLPLVLAVMLGPTAAAALTVQDVIALTKAGVSENVMIEMIDRDKTIFALDAAQVIALKRDGVSEKIVMALLKSGRDQAPAAADVAATTASLFPTEPIVVGVGHGPERPNTFHDFDALGGLVWPVTTPWLLPYSVPFVYSQPYSTIRSQRTVPACTSGQRVVSGARGRTGTVNCHRVR